MGRISNDTALIPSVLDRLIDHDPGATREAPKGQVQVLREMKQSLRRDLENLLNTRWRCLSWPPNMDELELSLVNYGLPDFSGANLGIAQNREEFRRVIERVIARFEPRLKNVKVQVLNDGSADRVLKFKIDALLQADPAPEPVAFESALEPCSGSFTVKGEQRA